MTNFVSLLLLFPVGGAADQVGDAKPDAHGFLTHPVESAFQGGPTEIKVLLPDRLEKGKKYPVVYVLPVEAGNGTQWGNGLLEVKKLDLHNKLGLIFVLPTFSHLPWYADHPTDAKSRQETYFLKVVVPFVESKYPVVAEPGGRLLLGFSKSGWGAFALLLRHPDLFGRAAAWDAPLGMDKPNRFGMADIFGTQENFEKFRMTKLLEARSKELGKSPRLAIMGYSNFRTHHVESHELMNRLGIAHEYRDEKMSPHTWHSGWVEPGMRWLVTGK